MLYLTVASEKRQPQNDGYVAIISDGHLQTGDTECTILGVEVVPNRKAARLWFRRMRTERPWEPRN